MHKNFEKLIEENGNIFKKINYFLLDSVNVSSANMPAEYSFIEEYFDLLSKYYNFLGYGLENYDGNYYLSVSKKDRYTSFEYFSKSETFLGMYFAIKYFQNMENPVFNANDLFDDLNSVFALENLYEIFVKKIQNFYESDKRLDTVYENYCKTLRQLHKFNFIVIMNLENANNYEFEIKGSIKRFFDLALELHDKRKNDELDLKEILEIFIKETDFDIIGED